MTKSDDLLLKADALLARWRAGAVAPGPPGDYPVLTEVVRAPLEDPDARAPRIPAEPEMPAILGTAVAAGAGDIPDLDSLEAPLLDTPLAPAGLPVAPLTPSEDLPRLPVLESSSALSAAEVDSLEQRIRSRVLKSLEPRIEAYLDEPLRARLEDLSRELAARLAADTREDIIALIRETVKTAVSRELGSRQDGSNGGH
jgi:hypothetical protein